MQNFRPGTLLMSSTHSGAQRWVAEAAVGGLYWAAQMLMGIKHSTSNSKQRKFFAVRFTIAQFQHVHL